ncbi:ABC transporter permease [Jiangella alba]|uniref:Peptide/nickel transport system permease protein n=1 Tax=Jiangella alba TaxID=561176 RepID=A0A1H5PXS2_9ACTN|nr:ABC transporter permease [Jiangella alba]SEF17988.1 peptide/nickel transport system permease protein [Jiangella alba]
MASTTPARSSGRLRTVRAGLTRSITGTIGGAVFLIMIVGALVAPLFVQADTATDLTAIYQPPSAAHWLGTDDEGKDIAKQILVGGRDIVIVGLVAAGVSTLIAVAFGALAAYRGGWVDSLIVQVTDFVLTVPQFVLLLVLSAYLRLDSATLLAVLLGLLAWPSLLRAVRAQVLSLKGREFVEAARLVDLGTWRILFREILPNMASYLLVHFILAMTGAVYALAGLYLLGLAPMSGTNWGIMIHQAWTKGAFFYSGGLPYILSPLIVIAILQLSAIWLVRSLEELLNPRLRAQG